MDTARVLGGKSLRIPVLLSYNGIAVKVNALLDSGADGYLYLNRSIAPKVRAAIGAPQDQLTRAADLKGYRTDDSDKVTTVLQAHLTIDGIKLLNEPFVEADLGNNEVIIGLLWFAEHRAHIDCVNRGLYWIDGKPTTAPFVKDIVMDISGTKKIDPRHQTDAARRDQLLKQEDKRRRDGKTRRTGIAHIRLADPPRIRRDQSATTFSTDTAASYQKMNRALSEINLLVTQGSSPERVRRKVDTAGMKLMAAFIGADAIKLWHRRSARERGQPSAVHLGSVSMHEVDKLLDQRWEERLAKCLPDKETEDVKTLIAKKLPAYLQDYADVCSKVLSDELPPNRASDHKIKLTNEEYGKALIMSPIYQMSLEHLQLLKEYLQENLAKGFISKSQAPYASPVLYAKKPGGGGDSASTTVASTLGRKSTRTRCP